MTKVVFAIPGDINTHSGGYLYDRRLISELTAQGVETLTLSLGDSFPFPSEDHLDDAAEKLGAVTADSLLMIDGLAFGALETNKVEKIKAPIIAMVHHPLAEETGLDDATKTELYQREKANLSFASAVIVTSNYTASVLQTKYSVPATSITVAPPGHDALSLKNKPQSPPLILSVGIQVYRKGHDVLIRALAKIQDLDWQAVIAGAELDNKYADQLRGLVDELGLSSRVELAGFVSAERVGELYEKATIFALATRFEGYGIVFNEALSHALPIVSCKVGAVAETLGEAGAIVEPDDPQKFALELRALLVDTEELSRQQKRSRAQASKLPSWSESFSKIVQLLTNLSAASRLG